VATRASTVARAVEPSPLWRRWAWCFMMNPSRKGTSSLQDVFQNKPDVELGTGEQEIQACKCIII
jgi:hypothetical protein